MTLSVNTNAGAMIALQNLRETNARLEVVQRQISTGLKVSSAKDNGAIYAIAQGMRAKVAGYNVVKQSLDRGTSVVDVAIAASESISDLLIEMRETALAASDRSLDQQSRNALNEDFVQLRDQIKTIIENAEFNGINLIKSGGDNLSVLANDDGSSRITFAAEDLSYGPPGGPGTNIILSEDATVSAFVNADLAISELDSSIDNVGAVLARLGSASKRLEIQRSFTDKLTDALEKGIGNLVDADMAKAAAELQALQVKQQLGIQALSIANQSPQILLQLFR
ncbi:MULTISPECIES: flagellin [Alphaproteobacteria]|uniref:flagellin n=1 Tax=Alphaproteobacteria TaxID=28211 RepID=UPI003298FCB3